MVRVDVEANYQHLIWIYMTRQTGIRYPVPCCSPYTTHFMRCNCVSVASWSRWRCVLRGTSVQPHDVDQESSPLNRWPISSLGLGLYSRKVNCWRKAVFGNVFDLSVAAAEQQLVNAEDRRLPTSSPTPCGLQDQKLQIYYTR